MVKKERFSLQENYSTFSFHPFILNLFKDDLINLIETTGKDFPKVDIQFGQKRLEHKIQFLADVESLAGKDGNDEKVFNHLYISLKTSTAAMIAANMILEITPVSTSLYIFDRSDDRLVKLGKDIMKIAKNADPVRFLKNRFVNIAIYLFDFAFLFYTVFLKDMIEKSLNMRMPDALIWGFILLLNATLAVPHGKNKIFLKNKKDMGLFAKYPEWCATLIILGAAAIDLVFVILKLLKVLS